MNKVYTSSLSASLFNWLNSFAKKTNSTKKEVIEKALLEYQKKLKKEELTRTFQRAAKDKEINQISEEGMDDYLQQLRSL